MKLTKEIKTAVLVIASILLFIWGYSFLKGKDLFSSYKTVYVEYDNVEGLNKSAPVTLNGLIIGKVNNISIDSNTARLLVELQISTDFPISKTSKALIYEPGFIGGKQIAIEPNFDDKVKISNGDKLVGKVKLGLTGELSNKLVPLEAKLEKVLDNADQLITGINNVLDKKTQENLKISLAELSKTMKEFHKASTNVNVIIDENKTQIKAITTNFNKITSDFSKVSDSINKADIGKTIKTLNNTLEKVNGIMADLKTGKGSMGKLLNDDQLYGNFVKTSKELELLLQDLRLNPTRYVNVSLFGKKNKPYKAPIKDTTTNNKN